MGRRIGVSAMGRIGVSAFRRVGVGEKRIGVRANERSAASDPLFENAALSQRFA